MDMVMPLLDTFLGIVDTFPDNPLKQLLRDYRNYQPVEHLAFVDDIKEKSKEFRLGQLCKEDPRSLLGLLKILDLVRAFRHTHWSFVVHYILEKSSLTHGSGGSDAVSFIPNQLLAVSEHIINLSQEISKDSDPLVYEEILQIKEKAEHQKESTLEQIAKFRSNIADDRKLLANAKKRALDLELLAKVNRKGEFFIPKDRYFFNYHELGLLSKKVA